MEKSNQKLIISDPKDGNMTPAKDDSKSTSRTEGINDRWHKDLSSRLIQKSESIEKAREQIMKLTENKNVLVNKLNEKHEEVRRLNVKVSQLVRELSALKVDHSKALDEIKMLKFKIREFDRKIEMSEQKKPQFEKIQRELIESQEMLTREEQKTKNLETMKLNPHVWQTMEYTDPHYFEILQKKNYLQKEVLKKIHLMQAKDIELEQKNELIKNLQSVLKCKPYNLTKDPNEQMMEFYKTIQLQRERIKILSAQVNMFESVFSDKYQKLRHRKHP